MEEEDPLFRLNPQTERVSETAQKAEQILAEHRRKMAERREHQESLKSVDRGITRCKIQDVHDLHILHEPDLDVFDNAREGVRSSADLERAKMFRIRSNSPPRGPKMRYEELDDSPTRRSVITPIKMTNERGKRLQQDDQDSKMRAERLFKRIICHLE